MITKYESHCTICKYGGFLLCKTTKTDKIDITRRCGFMYLPLWLAAVIIIICIVGCFWVRKSHKPVFLAFLGITIIFMSVYIIVTMFLLNGID